VLLRLNGRKGDYAAAPYRLYVKIVLSHFQHAVRDVLISNLHYHFVGP
jgi:hypothetical protein